MALVQDDVKKFHKSLKDIKVGLIHEESEDVGVSSASPVQSNIFAATLQQTGVKQSFKELQVLLAQISDMESYIHDYASGEMFQDLINQFYEVESRSAFNLKNLMGETEPSQDLTSTINETRDRLRQVGVAMDLIEQARDLIKSMYDRVEAYLNSIEEGFITRETRTENLISWAYRKGAKLNADVENFGNVVIETRASSIMTDARSLLVLFDELERYLGILAVLPAYYRTGISANTQNISVPTKTIRVKKDFSIERIAKEELGDADKATMIMEFNGLSFSDIQGTGWDGKQIKIPYLEEAPEKVRLYNFVLDAQAGVQALGKDLPDELKVDTGDLKVLNYTNTFFQSLDNIIRTPLGAIPEMSNYGSRVAGFIGGTIPHIAEGTAAIEVARALSTNPRVAYVTDVVVTKEQDAVKIKFHAVAANKIIESDLTGSLDTS